MIIVDHDVQILYTKPTIDIYKSIEAAARTCYQSQDKITPDSYTKFIKTIIKNKHHSVLEHENISCLLTTDRGILAEITRHRIGIAFSVASSRYISYKNPESFQVIKPIDIDRNTTAYHIWYTHMNICETTYNKLLEEGHSPQIARSVLPMSFACQIRLTANIREWRHMLSLRISPQAHPDMRYLMKLILRKFYDIYPILFDDIISPTKIKDKNINA
jgi:thymidylate synthase (FAD)